MSGTIVKSLDRALDWLIPRLERVMPDLSDLGLLMLVAIVVAAASGVDFSSNDEEVAAALVAANEAALACPNCVPF